MAQKKLLKLPSGYRIFLLVVLQNGKRVLLCKNLDNRAQAFIILKRICCCCQIFKVSNDSENR